jgi:DUF4097 and DUF4098 domain-containing protein YvlB
MKNKWFVASILIVVLIGLCGASIFAFWQGIGMAEANGFRWRGFRTNTVKAEATEEKNLTVSGPVTLTLENDFGDVSVQTGPDGQVNIKAEKTTWGINEADAQAALKDLTVVIEQDSNAIRVSVKQPADVEFLHIGPGGGGVKFTITVPKETAATLHSSNGDVSLSGTSGDADASSDFGNVTLTDLSGTVLGKSSNGAVSAANIASDGKVTLSSDFGRITLKDVAGSDVRADSANGQITLTDIRASGSLNADSQFGDIHAGSSRAASAHLESSNGKIEVENLDVSGTITAKSSFGSVTLTRVRAGAYDLSTQNGKISVDGDVQGSIKAHSSFGSVEVLNAENATLDLSSNNGSVTFSGSLGAGPHTLESDFGNIKISLPAETALDINMETDFGKITSDFSLTVTGEISDNHRSGTINGGGASLTVKTNNGNITLQSFK